MKIIYLHKILQREFETDHTRHRFSTFGSSTKCALCHIIFHIIVIILLVSKLVDRCWERPRVFCFTKMKIIEYHNRNHGIPGAPTTPTVELSDQGTQQKFDQFFCILFSFHKNKYRNNNCLKSLFFSAFLFHNRIH